MLDFPNTTPGADLETLTRELIQSLQIQHQTGVIQLTPTMLNKSIIDANKSVIDTALAGGVDYAALAPGDRVTLEGVHHATGEACRVTFYRAGGRGDKRISISGLKTHAGPGDTVALTYKAPGVLVVNITGEAAEIVMTKATGGDQ
jgi:hypothetical protein